MPQLMAKKKKLFLRISNKQRLKMNQIICVALLTREVASTGLYSSRDFSAAD